MILKIRGIAVSPKYLSIILFILYPISSLPFIVWGVFNKEKWAFVLFSLFMGLLAMLYPPAGDLYRYAEDFNLYKTCDWETFQVLLIFKFDYLLPFLSFAIGKLGGSVELTRFIFASVSYYLLFDLFCLVLKGNELLDSKRIYIYALVILVPLTFWTFLFRYYFALAFLLNGSYRWIQLRQKRGVALIVLSVFIHVSYLPFLFLCFFSGSRFLKFHYIVVVLLCLLVLFCDTTSIGTKILFSLPFSDSLLAHIAEYIDGSQSEAIATDFSFKQVIAYVISNLALLYIFFVYLKVYCQNITPFMCFINGILLMTLLTSSFPHIFTRLISVILFLTKVALLVWASKKLIDKYFKLIFCLTLITLLMAYWQRRYFLSDSYMYKIFTSTSIGVLTFSYSEKWVDNHLDEEGDFYSRLKEVGN